MRDRRSYAPGAASFSGRGLAVTGYVYWLSEDASSSLVLRMCNSCSVQDVGAVLGRRLSRPVCLDQLTLCPVLPPGLS
jgi:hypothetical protein